MLGIDGVISGFFALEGWQKTLVIIGILIADSTGAATIYGGLIPTGIIGLILSPIWQVCFKSDITSAGILFLTLMALVIWKFLLPHFFPLLMQIRQQRYLRR
jgi:hypothetical protein